MVQRLTEKSGFSVQMELFGLGWQGQIDVSWTVSRCGSFAAEAIHQLHSHPGVLPSLASMPTKYFILGLYKALYDDEIKQLRPKKKT